MKEKHVTISLDVFGLSRAKVEELKSRLSEHDINVKIVEKETLFASRQSSFGVDLIYSSVLKTDTLLSILRKEFLSTIKTVPNNDLVEGWVQQPTGKIAIHPVLKLRDEIIDSIKKQVVDFFSHPAVDPNLTYEIKEVSIKTRFSPFYDVSYAVIRIEVITNSRALFMGQFEGLQVGGPFGLFTGYLRGKIEYLLEESKTLDNSYVFFDVHEVALEGKPSISLQRMVPIEKMNSRGIVPTSALLCQLLSKHGLSYAGLIGLDISGPVPGLMLIIEELLKENKPNSLLELFCGTGAYSKIVLDECEFCSATLIDLGNLDVAQKQLLNYRDRCDFHQIDAFEYVPDMYYDWIIADPYDNLVLPFAQRIIPHLAPMCGLFVTSICFSENRSYLEAVEIELKKNFQSVEIFDIADVLIAVCKQ